MADAENAPAQPAGSEPAQHAVDKLTSEESIDSMLASVEGFDKYFGDGSDQSDKPAKESASAAPGESGTAGHAVDEILAGGDALAEKKETGERADGAEIPEAVQARIDRLTAARRDLESSVSDLTKENTELKTKLSTAGQRGPMPTPQDPLSNITDYQGLEQRLIDAKAAKKWALENLDGGVVEVNSQTGETRELSGQEVKHLLSLSETLITEQIPRRKAYLDARQDFDRQADSYYTDYAKPQSELSKTLQAWVNMFPEMTRFPDFRLIVADALVGQKIRFGKLAIGNGAGAKAPTLAAPSPSGSARVPAKSVLSKSLLDRMATDRSALDVFSESLIGTGRKK